MNIHTRAMAAVLVPLLALSPSCAAPSRNRAAVHFQLPNGETDVDVPESGGQPIEVPEAELWSSFRVAALELRPVADPLAFAEQTFGLAEASGTYWYLPRTRRLVPGTLGFGLEEVDSAAERLTRGYLDWCGGTSLGGGDCLRLLLRGQTLTLHGRYVVTLVMAMTASFGPMLESLEELADPSSVAVMLASAVAVYLLLLLVPEPTSKLIAIGLTGALIGYLGLDMFWRLVYGARALSEAVDAATEFSQLETAARNFGKVLGPQMGQLLILLVSHSLGKGLAAKGKVSPPPRFADATAQAKKLTRGRLGPGAATGVRSVTLDSGVITISLTAGALMVGAPSSPGTSTGGQDIEPHSKPGETADPLDGKTADRGRELPFKDPERISEVNKALSRIRSGGPFHHKKDGAIFRNDRGRLPQREEGYYREYTVETPGASNRGTRRIVQGNGGEIYYTDDHYESFIRIDQGGN